MENNYNNGEENNTPLYTDPNAAYENTVGNAGENAETMKTNEVGSTMSSSESEQDLNKNYQYGSGDYSQTQNYNQNYNNQSYGQNNNQYYNNQGYNQNYGQNYNNQSYNQNYNNQGYNQNYNMDYNQGMDTTPLTMGQWVLTILAAWIPCAGVILYLVWAFSKTGNINRRNFCRATLIIEAVVLLLYIIFAVVFGAALVGAGSAY